MAPPRRSDAGTGASAFPGAEIKDVKPCLNGSLFYLPALAALIVVGLLLEERRHRAAPYLLWAAAIFAVSITLRSLDHGALREDRDRGPQSRHAFRLAYPERAALFLLLRASLEGGLAAVRVRRD